jgi:hypothetical protein
VSEHVSEQLKRQVEELKSLLGTDNSLGITIDMATVSLAINMKRIADAMERGPVGGLPLKTRA